jgi:transposase
MRDIELYKALLGLTAPWTVAGVDVDMKGQRVVVRVDVGSGPFPCPKCRTPTARYDSKPRRWWRPEWPVPVGREQRRAVYFNTY